MVDDPKKTEKVHTHQQGVIDKEQGFTREQAQGDCHQETENRGRIGGICQPVFAQVPNSRLGVAMQEILILVGCIERCLVVCQCKDGCK